MAKFRETIELGVYNGSSRDFDRIIDELKDQFPGSTYNLLTRNCNHFANELVSKLLNKPIPGYVNRLANLGGMVSCLLPPQMLGDAPVDQQSRGSENSSGFQVIVPRGREVLKGKSADTTIPNQNTTPTQSTGFILGGSSTDSNPSNLGIHERREKARLAALKRMGKEESSSI